LTPSDSVSSVGLIESNFPRGRITTAPDELNDFPPLSSPGNDHSSSNSIPRSIQHPPLRSSSSAISASRKSNREQISGPPALLTGLINQLITISQDPKLESENPEKATALTIQLAPELQLLSEAINALSRRIRGVDL
jgi:hypothetical protein